jgi:hypothetical protein
VYAWIDGLGISWMDPADSWHNIATVCYFLLLMWMCLNFDGQFNEEKTATPIFFRQRQRPWNQVA